jgi:hypothetical protein
MWLVRIAWRPVVTAPPEVSLICVDQEHPAYTPIRHEVPGNRCASCVPNSFIVHQVGQQARDGFLGHLSDKATFRSFVFLDPAAFHGTNDPRDTGHVNECIALGGNASGDRRRP